MKKLFVLGLEVEMKENLHVRLLLLKSVSSVVKVVVGAAISSLKLPPPNTTLELKFKSYEEAV
ncbi:CLUMA_CG007783, isoform A [Clunio marinus]|uniref:CLUMA_CG007783, isoform A n=1 Tax=Clunio marinus TaxID=568069 RepID=A0A1J1I3U6_9DIPT|nr:CLUMA_CG007783, isoform A [Clunio marinus]